VSLILDALNRARQERGEVGPTALPTTVVEPPEPGPLVAVLALALVLAAVIIGWLAWERWDSDDGEPGAAAVRQAAPATAARGAPSAQAAAATPAPRPEIAAGDRSREAAAVPSRERAGTAVTAADPAVAALYANPPDARPAAPPAARPEAAAGGPDAAAKAEAPQEAAPRKAAPRKAAPREETIDIEAVVARAREELGEPALSPHPAPLLADLSQQQKDAIPTLMYLRHDYVENGTSSVLINGQTRRVGDRIGAVQVEEILRDSVVLRHRDTLFRLRALNSWVNL
jgi:hypothetical protein